MGDLTAQILANPRTKPLPWLEMQELVQRAQQGDLKARNQVVERNLRYVAKAAIARKKNSKSQLDDLIQIGVFGIIRALETFDASRSIMFLSYAQHWVNTFIRHQVEMDASIVHFATSGPIRKVFSSLGRVSNQLQTQLHREPTTEESAQALGVKTQEVERVLSAINGGTSLTMQGDVFFARGTPTFDLVSSMQTPEESYSNQEQTSRVRAEIQAIEPHLTAIERYILHFRIMAEDPETLVQIGKKLGCTGECIRQKEQRLIRRLRAQFQRFN